MMHPGTPPPDRLRLESLEARELPSTAAWLVEPFQRGPSSGLPTGWAQSGGKFAVDTANPGLGDTGYLRADTTTTTAARAWVVSPFAADVETTAAVYLSSPSPVQVFVRGQKLETATASYYAGAVTRGGEVQLLRVLDGVTTVLGSVRSAEYLSNRWVQMKVRAEGDRVSVFLLRGDTNQYLGPDGKWTRRPTAAVEVTDVRIRSSGRVGFARPANATGAVQLDSLRVTDPNASRTTALVEERFAKGTATGLPAGWAQWSSVPTQTTFATQADETLRVSAASTASARGWVREYQPADVQVSSSMYVDSLVPASVFARGQNLYIDRPSYYSLTVTRGLEVSINKMIDGKETKLAGLKSADWLSGLWVQTSLAASGDELRAQVYRTDTGQYLTAAGTWSLAPAWALTVRDASLKSGGSVGVSRGGGYAGELVFDNLIVTSAPTRSSVAGPIPTELDKPTATPRPPEDTTPTPVPTPPPSVPPPPVSVPVTPGNLPVVARSYSHIRVANLAYYGTPFTSYEQALLRNGVDLVIPNVAYLSTIAAAAPDTPQFVYTNVSNIYLGLYTDWLAYADKNKLSREGAFFHVTRPTAYTGLSASSVPVHQLWGVYKQTAGVWKDATSDNRNTDRDVAFGAAGDSVAFGYPEKYRELTFDLKTMAGTGWTGQVEYARAVDANGLPTAWGTVTLKSDGTTGFRRDGTITFDPPPDWVPASIGGSARLYYVRVRTTAGTVAPVAASVIGRDYTNGKDKNGGTIPAFDTTADRDGDGYLNDTEYARRKAGSDARFVYETRMFYPTYGPMRFATNVSDAGFRGWVTDYHSRLLRTVPLATGFFVDNSNGKLALDTTGVKESLDNYPVDYGSLLGAVNKKLAPKWVIANTAGGGPGVEQLAKNGVSYLEEFGLRPVSSNHIQFDDLLANLTYRRQLSGGKAYEILDSLPVGLDANDPRVQISTLAMYYAVADPDRSFLMLNGGNEPASGWQRHWFNAIPYNVGRPTGTASQFATGNDPADASLVYKVYKRDYQNALVLYKPLSYTRGKNGTTVANTATTHDLGGTYRPLRADGSLGAPVTRITLRNGEGAVLIKSR